MCKTNSNFEKFENTVNLIYCNVTEFVVARDKNATELFERNNQKCNLY